ncbi:MAG: NAD(P)-dependent alcohol dehydrogenase [Armatimonadetes bacterium]|nr:NAD(P)-dependent alcohol dehydrogenase [Anaerolineae bacterium]
MKAMIFTNYGSPDVLQLADVAKPTPKDDEVLIKIHATTVTMGDTEIRRFKMAGWVWLPMRVYMGITKPRIKILGMELAGEVEALGKDVTRFKPGDPVFGATGLKFGAYAEYVCLPSSNMLATKPINMSYEQAAAVPVGGIEALHFLTRANLQRGQKVLINGAGGTIGTFAVQIAKSLGAEVTGVDRTEKLDLLRTLGADHVIDYTQADFTQNGQTYDVIFDVVGKSVFARCIKSLNPNGRYLLANPKLSQMLRALWISRTSSKRIIFGAANESIDDLMRLKALIEAGEIKTVIDRRYPLEQLAEAHRFVDTGRKQGNVIITVGQ